MSASARRYSRPSVCKQLCQGGIRYFRGRVYVSPKVIQQADGDTVEIPRQIGKGTICEVRWPHYQRPSYTDQDTYSRVITTMLSNDPKIMTRRTAIKLLAPIMDYDAMQELHALKKEEEQEANDAAMAAEEGGEEGEEAPASPAENPVAWKTALEAGIITLNEYREKALNLGEIPDGDLTMPQYHSKYAQTFVSSVAATSEKSVDIATGKQEADESRNQESHDMKKEMHEEAKKDKAASRKAMAEGVTPGSNQPGSASKTPSSGKPGSTPKRPNSAPAKPSSGSSAPAKAQKSKSE